MEDERIQKEKELEELKNNYLQTTLILLEKKKGP